MIAVIVVVVVISVLICMVVGILQDRLDDEMRILQREMQTVKNERDQAIGERV